MIVAALAVLTAMIHLIMSFATAIPILEVLTDSSKLPIWLGTLTSVIAVLATGDEKYSKCESQKTNSKSGHSINMTAATVLTGKAVVTVYIWVSVK